MENICPDCIEKLVPNRKKLGDLTQWLICKKCGYRIRPTSTFFSNRQEGEELTHEIERINENNYYEDIYNIEDYNDGFRFRTSAAIM